MNATGPESDRPPEAGAAPAEAPAPPVGPPPPAAAPAAPAAAGPPRWRRHVCGLVLAGACLAVLLATARDIGFARDEGFYFSAADSYQEWFDVLFKKPGEAMKKETIERYWSNNSEHPPLMKVLFGFSHRLLHKKLGWLGPSTSYRFPGMLSAALLLYLVFVFTARRFGELEAFFAAVFLALLPRFFYHAHLDAFDVPITLMTFLTVYCFEKSFKSNLWAVLAGVAWGLALLTKLNAFFLGPTLFLVWVLRDVIRPTPSAVLAAVLFLLSIVFKMDMWFVLAAGVVLVLAVLAAGGRSLRPGASADPAVRGGAWRGFGLLLALLVAAAVAVLLGLLLFRARPAGGAAPFVTVPAICCFVGAAVCLVAALVAANRVWCAFREGHATLPRIPAALPAMVVLGPAMLWAGWPLLWHDTVKHFSNYVKFHVNHDYYNIAYFGVNYTGPPLPFSYPFGMTALTVPVVTLAAALLGMILCLRFRVLAIHRDLAERAAGPGPAPAGRLGAALARARALLLAPWRSARPGPLPEDEVSAALTRNPGLGVVLAVNLAIPILIIAHPKVYIFGGTKHWMPAWPFLTIFAGIGAAWAVRRIARLVPERWAAPRVGGIPLPLRGAVLALAALLCVAPAVQGTMQSHPFALSHYNLLAGGVPGSADLGMCRQFWGFTTGSLVPWLNANVPRNGRVFFHDTAWESYRMLQTDGTMRPDIHWAPSPEAADIALIHHEMHWAGLEHSIWQAYGVAAPAHVLTHHGVSIISVYVRPGTKLGVEPPASARPKAPALTPGATPR